MPRAVSSVMLGLLKKTSSVPILVVLSGAPVIHPERFVHLPFRMGMKGERDFSVTPGAARLMPMEDSERMLLIVQDRDEMDDRASAWARRQGHELKWICPAEGDRLPELDERVAGVIVYGGAQDVDHQEKLSY